MRSLIERFIAYKRWFDSFLYSQVLGAFDTLNKKRINDDYPIAKTTKVTNKKMMMIIMDAFLVDNCLLVILIIMIERA